MEFNFLFLVAVAIAGLIINAIWGFNPVAMFGVLSLLVLFLPVWIRISFFGDTVNSPSRR